jgi:hypothetical protein
MVSCTVYWNTGYDSFSCASFLTLHLLRSVKFANLGGISLASLLTGTRNALEFDSNDKEHTSLTALKS